MMRVRCGDASYLRGRESRALNAVVSTGYRVCCPQEAVVPGPPARLRSLGPTMRFRPAMGTKPLSRQRVHLVIGGHVDHGKSTVIGRLLADAGVLPQGKLDQVREQCARTSRPFEYAFLLDALKDEQAQGITIDAARVFFRQGDREYVILDAP